jgi:hypothetical protein
MSRVCDDLMQFVCGREEVSRVTGDIHAHYCMIGCLIHAQLLSHAYSA